jgi:hypothetical protein
MAITKFQPKIWSANILANLRAQLVYAGPGISNRDYEGDISAYGDTVHMVSFSDPAVRTYSKGGPITWDVLTDAENLLVVNQSDYFAFTVDDIDKRQALPGFIAKASQGASYNLVKNADTYVATNLLTAVNGSGNDLGALSVTVAANDFYGKFFVGARTKLNKANVPYAGRWAVIPPDATGYLLQDPRFVANPQLAGSGMADVVNDGIIGDAGEQADSFSGDDMGANPLIGRIAGSTSTSRTRCRSPAPRSTAWRGTRWPTRSLTRSARPRPCASRPRASSTASAASTSTVARSTTPPRSRSERSRWRKPRTSGSSPPPGAGLRSRSSRCSNGRGSATGWPRAG